MTNRPSYAQLTLELTRRSLQCVPSHLTPTVSGLLVVPTGELVRHSRTVAHLRTPVR